MVTRYITNWYDERLEWKYQNISLESFTATYRWEPQGGSLNIIGTYLHFVMNCWDTVHTSWNWDYPRTSINPKSPISSCLHLSLNPHYDKGSRWGSRSNNRKWTALQCCFCLQRPFIDSEPLSRGTGSEGSTKQRSLWWLFLFGATLLY